MEDFHGVPLHLTTSSTHTSKCGDGIRPPSKTRMVRGMAVNAGLQAVSDIKSALYSKK